MSSNIKSNLWLCNFACRRMAEKGGGSVVIVSSIGGLRGSAQLGAYGISKAADMQLTRSLAVEWGPKNVRINCVAPGLVKTDFARALWEDPERLKRDRVDRRPAAHRRTRRDRRRRRLPGLQGVRLHDGHGHRRRRRRDDRRVAGAIRPVWRRCPLILLFREEREKMGEEGAACIPSPNQGSSGSVAILAQVWRLDGNCREGKRHR